MEVSLFLYCLYLRILSDEFALILSLYNLCFFLMDFIPHAIHGLLKFLYVLKVLFLVESDCYIML
jgi:hypothetical protein